jgi:hypothetical protein
MTRPSEKRFSSEYIAASKGAALASARSTPISRLETCSVIAAIA